MPAYSSLLTVTRFFCFGAESRHSVQFFARMQLQMHSTSVRPIRSAASGFRSGPQQPFNKRSQAGWPRFQNPLSGVRVPAGRSQQQPFRQLSNGSGGGGRIGAAASGGGGGGGSGSGAGLWDTYLRLLEQSPILTKAWTAALLNAIGDIISQVFIENHSFSKLDWKRLGIFTFLGFVMVGPLLHWWYGTLGRVITASGNTGAALRLILDQVFWAPLFIAGFISALFTLEGHPNQIQGKLKQDLKTTVIANWKLWVPFQFLNFRFIPGNLQVLAANVVAVAWNTYLSNASHSAVATQPEKLV